MDGSGAPSYSGDLDLAEINKRGKLIDVHNQVHMVTVGIASTSPVLPLPNVMLLARPVVYIEDQPPAQASSKTRMDYPHPSKTLQLTRLLPLKFVKISIHDREKQQLRLKLASGRSFYLQLCPPSDAREDLFVYWEKLIYLLRPPVEGYSSHHAIPAGDGVRVPVFMTEEECPSQEPILHSEEERYKVSIKSIYMIPELLGQDKMAVKPEIIMEAAAEEGFPSPRSAEKELLSHHYTIQGVPSMSPPSTPSVPSIAVAATASRGPPGMGAATAGSQGPGVSVALAGTASEQETETVSASSVSLMLAGAANMSPDSVSVASVGTGSLTPSGHISMASAGSGGIAIAGIGTITPLGPDGSPLVSALHNEGYISERDRSQRVTVTSSKASKERRSTRRHSGPTEGRAHKGTEQEGSSGQRRSSRRAVTSKETQKSSHWLRRSRHSPSSPKATSPSTKDSRASHKRGKSKSSTSSPATAPTKKPSRIASFLRSFSRSSQSTKSTSVLRSVGEMAEALEASVTEIDMSTSLENVESIKREMKTMTETLSPPAAEEEGEGGRKEEGEGGRKEEEEELLHLQMDSVGDSHGPAPSLVPSLEAQH
ncbi:Golgi-associated RAB2 interactor protein 3-like isoform X2 [Petaurus breviceps papuanus]|uniref:Golgi-associated RAB2 interactor protein 3-like isoform X2 n=1 Tax=Petaurus breviceps papuanus TaxID=3040969 RepID=UPI0036DDFA01